MIRVTHTRAVVIAPSLEDHTGAAVEVARDGGRAEADRPPGFAVAGSDHILPARVEKLHAAAERVRQALVPLTYFPETSIGLAKESGATGSRCRSVGSGSPESTTTKKEQA